MFTQGLLSQDHQILGFHLIFRKRHVTFVPTGGHQTSNFQQRLQRAGRTLLQRVFPVQMCREGGQVATIRARQCGGAGTAASLGMAGQADQTRREGRFSRKVNEDVWNILVCLAQFAQVFSE